MQAKKAANVPLGISLSTALYLWLFICNKRENRLVNEITLSSELYLRVFICNKWENRLVNETSES